MLVFLDSVYFLLFHIFMFFLVDFPPEACMVSIWGQAATTANNFLHLEFVSSGGLSIVGVKVWLDHNAAS
jgi:hypothetical protein